MPLTEDDGGVRGEAASLLAERQALVHYLVVRRDPRASRLPTPSSAAVKGCCRYSALGKSLGRSHSLPCPWQGVAREGILCFPCKYAVPEVGLEPTRCSRTTGF
jgi:hypothetical protein